MQMKENENTGNSKKNKATYSEAENAYLNDLRSRGRTTQDIKNERSSLKI
jgi:hypothetical protein